MPTEFEFIRNLKDKYGLNRVGDDCAVLPKNSKADLVITADMLVEDIDFRLKWTTPEHIGHKALAVSLSDIAAMGGTPKWAILSIAVPAEVWDGGFVDRFYEGWFKLAQQHNVELVGGDVSRSSAKIVIDSIVGGETVKGHAVLRSGARPGDFIFVTGSVGGAAGALELLESGVSYAESRGKKRRLLERQLCPTPQIEAGQHLSSRKLASSMIDISDGLGADLYHICDSSSVGAVINLDAIPVDGDLDSFSILEKRAFAIGGGEDFELLFTSKREEIFDPKLPLIHRIGVVTANVGIVELVTDDSRSLLPRIGYRHF